jgi:NADH-quinone oxidoreductase subunit J
VLGSAVSALGDEGAPYDPGFGTPERIGTLLLTKFLIPFEIASFLLLVAAVGGVLLARRRRGLDPDPIMPETHVPLEAGSMAEATGLLHEGRRH